MGKKKTFRIKADVIFEAENIIDALAELAEYFDQWASTAKEPDTIFNPGEVTVELAK